MKCHATYSPHFTPSTSLAGQSLMNSQICRWLTQPLWRQGKAEPLSYRERSWFSLSKGKRRMKLRDELAEYICSFLCISLHMYELRKCHLVDKRYLPVLFTMQVSIQHEIPRLSWLSRRPNSLFFFLSCTHCLLLFVLSSDNHFFYFIFTTDPTVSYYLLNQKIDCSKIKSLILKTSLMIYNETGMLL